MQGLGCGKQGHELACMEGTDKKKGVWLKELIKLRCPMGMLIRDSEDIQRIDQLHSDN